MLPKKIVAYILVLGCLFPVIAFAPADDDAITTIVNKLTQWTENNPQEKVYLHTDKPFYSAGDNIWFEAYVTVGEKHQLSALSAVLNVELISSNDSVMRVIKLPVQSGTAAGDFELPNDIPVGIYHLRAYTNYMRNAGDEYIFDKTIAIGNDVTDAANRKDKKLSAVELAALTNKVDVQFFPEGGTLINGFPCKVGFKAIDGNGSGVNIKAVITDNENHEVATISEDHLGMGAFSFTPEKGKNYLAQITSENGAKETIQLPAATDNGYLLSIDNSNADKAVVKIAAGESMEAGTVNLIAQQNGRVCYAAKANIDATGKRIEIAKSKFNTGIVQFTLFSATAEPLKERLAFIQNDDLLKLNVNAEKQQYAPRQKVNINLDVKDGANKPVKGIFSVAVIDESKVPVDESAETTILSNLLLTPDLKGAIEKPNYYFTNPNNQTKADLDALMLTQGYRRFVWKKILNEAVSEAPKYEAEKALSINGSVKLPGGKPLKGGKVTLTSSGGGFFEADTLTDDKGRFSFGDLAYGDSTKFLVQATKAGGGRNVVLELDKPNLPGISYKMRTGKTKDQAAIVVKPSDNAVMNTYLQQSVMDHQELVQKGIVSKARELKQVNIQAEKIQEATKYSENMAGPGNADQVITHDDLKYFTCVRLVDCIAQLGNNLKLVNVQSQKYGAYQAIIGGRSSVGSSTNAAMYLVVDGVPLEWVNTAFLDANDVISIEILKSAGYTGAYGANGGAGVIVITTVNNTRHPMGDFGKRYEQKYPDVVVYTPIGYYRAREFYSPKYDAANSNTNKPDLRSTIFWQPKLITDAEGKATFGYFNADGKGNYKVVVEGIDGQGDVGRQVYRYKVQ